MRFHFLPPQILVFFMDPSNNNIHDNGEKDSWNIIIMIYKVHYGLQCGVIKMQDGSGTGTRTRVIPIEYGAVIAR